MPSERSRRLIIQVAVGNDGLYSLQVQTVTTKLGNSKLQE